MWQADGRQSGNERTSQNQCRRQSGNERTSEKDCYTHKLCSKDRKYIRLATQIDQNIFLYIGIPTLVLTLYGSHQMTNGAKSGRLVFCSRQFSFITTFTHISEAFKGGLYHQETYMCVLPDIFRSQFRIWFDQSAHIQIYYSNFDNQTTPLLSLNRKSQFAFQSSCELRWPDLAAVKGHHAANIHTGSKHHKQ